MRRFESSRPSQAVRRTATLPKKSEIGPETPAFRAFDFVSKPVDLQVLRKLGLGSPAPSVPTVTGDGESRLATLRALAKGQLGVEEARQQLSGS